MARENAAKGTERKRRSNIIELLQYQRLGNEDVHVHVLHVEEED